IVEVMIAIFVVTIGVLAAHAVTQQMISYTYHSASRLTAVYLNKEGIEIVRNIRDTNWLQKEANWKDGLPGGNWEADYTTTTFANTANDSCGDPGHNCEGCDDEFLKIDGGLYKYSGSGTQTNFKRKITIDDTIDHKGDDILKITVEVRWEYKGDTYGPITA
ncbi:unnamed protein product, partial [marine sediment metagenome]